MRLSLNQHAPSSPGSGAGLDLFAARLDPEVATKLKPAALLGSSDGGGEVLICSVSIAPNLASWTSTSGFAPRTAGSASRALDTATSDFASGIIGIRYAATALTLGLGWISGDLGFKLTMFESLNKSLL
jgi:hypothetical protein